MRKEIAVLMEANPDIYDEEFLGKRPDLYIKWMLRGSSSWAGIPELQAIA